MKRIITLCMMLIVASLSFNASAQSKRLIGEWRVTTEDGDNAVDNVNMTFEFDKEKEGDIKISYNNYVEVMEVIVNFTVLFDIDILWSANKERLSIEPYDAEIDVENIYLTPSGTEYDELLPEIENVVRDMFEQGKQEFISNFMRGEMTYTIINKNTVEVLPPSGKTMILKRIER